MTDKVSKTVEERVAGLEGEMSHVSNQLENLTRDMKRGFENISSGSKTQWSPVIAGITLLAALVAMYGSGISKDMDRMEAASIRTLEAVQIHIQSEGHAGVQSRLEDLRRDLTGFAERNSDQIQTLDSAFHDVTRALRAKDAEIASNVAVNRTKIEFLEEKRVQ